jgi:hypothetical protein
VSEGTKAVALEQDAANKTFDDAQRAVAAYAFGFGTAQAATDALKKADQELSAELDILFGRFLSADQATNNYKLAVVDLGDKLLANGFAFDDHSKAGLEDRNMLDDLASKASAAGKAIFDQTGNVEAAKGPLLDFRAHVQTLRDAMATAGQDTSFLDGMLATVDRAIAGINEKVPETHAAGKAHGHAVGDGSIEELPHSDDAGHQHGHRHAQAVHDTAPESGAGGQAHGLAAVAGSLTELDNIFGAGQQHGAHHAEGINTLAGASLTEGANLGAQTALGSLGQLDNVTGAGATLGAGSAQGAGSQAGAHLTVGAGLGANVGSGVGSVGGLVAGAASFIAAQGASAAGGHRGDYAAAGAESAAGLADGIRSVVGDVVAAARSVASAASPRRVRRVQHSFALAGNDGRRCRRRARSGARHRGELRARRRRFRWSLRGEPPRVGRPGGPLRRREWEHDRHVQRRGSRRHRPGRRARRRRTSRARRARLAHRPEHRGPGTDRRMTG